jgi:hypothetical protein
MSLKVVPLHSDVSPEAKGPRLRDVVAMLRTLADDIERGEHGVKEAKAKHGEAAVVRVALVLRVSNVAPAVFGFGDLTPAQMYMDLHSGADQLMNMQAPERG